MQGALATLALLAVGPWAAAATGFDITEGDEVTVFAQGASNVATVMLSATRGIACYLDTGNSVKDGWCNVIDLSGSPSVVGSLLISEEKPKFFALDRFSDSQAVMCYSRQGTDGLLICNVLEVTGATLEKGADLSVDPDAVYFLTFTVATFTDTAGVVCYADPTNTVPSLQVKCVPIAVNTGDLTLTKGSKVEVLGSLEQYRKAHHVDRVSVTGFSPTTAVVCAQLEEQYVGGPARTDCPAGSECIPYGGFCHVLTLEDSELSVGVYSIFSTTAVFDTAVASLDATTGILCYSGGAGVVMQGNCLPFSLGERNLTLIEESIVEVNSADTLNVIVVGMSDTAAMVCYLDGAEARVGTCNGLVLSHGTDLQMGDDKVVVDGDWAGPEPCVREFPEKCGNFMASSAVLSPLNMDGLVCYAGLGGNVDLRCRMLAVPPPTTTTTGTTSTETSSTTPHTTTESSTTTMTTTATTFTRTTRTTTETTTTSETSSTTPHTTTETSTTQAPESNAGARAAASAGVAALLVLGMCAA